MSHGDLPPTKRTVIAASAGGGSFDWGIAEEVAVEVGFNGEAWAVMMATPADVEDLAIGLAMSEDALVDPAHVTAVTVKGYREGVTADIAVEPRHLNTSALRRRALRGVTGCGLCGVETLADAIRAPKRQARPRGMLDLGAVALACRSLSSHQPLNKLTRTTHAAAWCDASGEVLLAREDVGRHNALDKLIGAMAKAGWPAAPGFIAMSSRCSFELVSKAARTPAALLATLSAPTGYALDLARAVGLPLAAMAPDGHVMLFPQGETDAQ